MYINIYIYIYIYMYVYTCSIPHDFVSCTSCSRGERIFVERMTSDRKLKASREGSK